MVLNTMMLCDSALMAETAVRICRGYLNGPWKKITPKDISLKRISGGLSNWLYAVRLLKEPDASALPGRKYPSQVLLRLYGQTNHQGEGALESIITESVIFTLLSERNLGPKLYGIFPGGRIEEYIPARPLKRHEMSNPELSLLVADKMAAIHTMNVPITKEPSWIWDTFNRWLSNIKEFCNECNTDNNPSKVFKTENYEKLSAEVEWLKTHLSKVSSPVLFCHNDLQGGNILVREDTDINTNPSIVIIDFEYCSYNYRGFDLANHFIEWAYDYSAPNHPNFSVDRNNMASIDMQKRFLERYLSSAKANKSRYGDSNVECLLNEVRHFSLASHLFWSLWSFVNAKVSQIPFGYYEYAEERLRCYYELKGDLVGGSGSKEARD